MVKRINKNKKTMAKRQGIKKSKTMKVSKNNKHVTRKVSNKKKSGKSKSGKKSKKVLISKLVTRNKLKKMMKGGANLKYEELIKTIKEGQPLSEIELSYVEPSTAEPGEPEQPPQGWFNGITSSLSSFVSKATNVVSGFVKGSGQVTPQMFSALAALLRTQRPDGTIQISNVQSIDLSNNNLSSFEPGSFNGFDAVKILNLSNNKFTNESIKSIFTPSAASNSGNQPSQPILPSLTTLFLTGNTDITQDLNTDLNTMLGRELNIVIGQSNNESQEPPKNNNTPSIVNTNTIVTGNVNTTTTGNVNTTATGNVNTTAAGNVNTTASSNVVSNGGTPP
jgi:hypothetical protein